MAIKVQGTTVIDDSRNLQNVPNVNLTGNVYANTFVGDATNLSNLPASGGSITAVASGTLSDGTAVIVNSDGTLSAITGDENSVGTAVSYDTSGQNGDSFNGQWKNVIVDYLDVSGGRIVVVRNEGEVSGQEVLSAHIGTISGSTISFGSPQLIDNVASAVDLAVIDSNKFVVVYSGYAYHLYTGKAIVCTVSGTTVTRGDPTTFESDYITVNQGGPKLAWDSNASKLVVAYAGYQYDYDGFARVLTVSGTSISVASRVAFESSTAIPDRLAQDCVTGLHFDTSTNKLIVVYHTDNTASLKIRIGSVSGTSTTWGSAVSPKLTVAGAYYSNSSRVPNVWDQYNNRLYLIQYISNPGTGLPSNSWHVTAGTISGNSMTFDVELPLLNSDEFDLGTSMEYVAVAIDQSTGRMIIGIKNDIHEFESFDTSTNTFTRKATTVAGTYPGVSAHRGAVYVPSVSKFVHTFQKSNSSNGTDIQAYTPRTTTLTTENFIGISDGSYANGALATVQTKGSVDDAQSSLTIGKKYYVLPNGTLNSTASTTTSVFAGTAIASNKLIVKG